GAAEAPRTAARGHSPPERASQTFAIQAPAPAPRDAAGGHPDGSASRALCRSCSWSIPRTRATFRGVAGVPRASTRRLARGEGAQAALIEPSRGAVLGDVYTSSLP